jgi:hypothetical protein
MKTKYIPFLLLLTICNSLFSQTNTGDKTDKLKSFKIAFITEKLQLSPKEAQTFWPIYNEYEAKKQAIQDEELKTTNYYTQLGDKMSEKEASEISDKLISYQKREAQLAEEYNAKFKTVLPATKVLKLYQAEVQFKRQLLKRLREGQEQGVPKAK